MKPTTLLVILIAFPICVHMTMITADNAFKPFCPNSYFPASVQENCNNIGSKCKTKFAEGICGHPEKKCLGLSNCHEKTITTESRCCPDASSPVHFQTNIKCTASDDLDYLLYCKNGYAFQIDDKTLKSKKGKECRVHSHCGEGGYCIRLHDVTRFAVSNCFVIGSPKKEGEGEGAGEEEDNTMLTIIIVVIVVVLIAVAGIVATVFILKKKKKGKIGHKSSASKETTSNGSTA
ncbi:unnamed protein product [Caenorhabditis angaria]|uniref:Domain of unknown function DX domain-containing protein n=1 Tax=Caenorhabditis angaria TaxID=860376 RepID=A0A9P1IL24_9PELO|nr:unnamed protein product [Caenorhabditis angaria]